MEGIILEPEALGFAAALGAVIVLVLVAAGIALGYIADEERKGNRVMWAEWPLPGTEEPEPPAVPAEKPESRKVA